MSQLETPRNRANTFVNAVILMAVITVGSIVTIYVVRPDRDNTAIIATILGFVTPIVLAFLAVAIKEVQQAVNGRLTQLLELTEKAAIERGKVLEQQKRDVLR